MKGRFIEGEKKWRNGLVSSSGGAISSSFCGTPAVIVFE